MILIGREKLTVFIRNHANIRGWIENWISDVEGADWKNTLDIKKRYSSASFLKENHVVFNVKGNSYRLLIQVAFRTGKVLVKWIGSHAEYSKLF